MAVALAFAAVACSPPQAPEPVGPDRDKSTIEAESPAVADGVTAARITVRVVDHAGEPLAGVNVVLTSSTPGDVLEQPPFSTDSQGVARGSIASSVFGESIVRATADGVSLRRVASVRFLEPCAEDETRCGEACVQLDSDDAHCGECGRACVVDAHGTGQCNGGRCEQFCAAGWGDCNGEPDDGCEQALATDRHCGACGRDCTAGAPRNGAGYCADAAAQRCAMHCEDGWGDCDGNPANGCEQRLDDAAHCGACGVDCRIAANGTGTCADPATRACGVTCDAAFADCDEDAGNGCEQKLDDAAHCGACDRACPGATNAAGACLAPEAGACGLRCQPGWGDCTGADGCETHVGSDDTNCGACGVTCGARPVASGSCRGGRCEYACLAGFADCNLDLDDEGGDGCETDLSREACACQASPVGATSSCVTAGTGARTTVWTQLRTAAGVAVRGAQVAIDSADLVWLGPVEESVARPGTYFRTAEPRLASGDFRVRIVANDATSCRGTATLRSVVVRVREPADAGRGGGTGGCSPQDGNVRVRVVAEETGALIAGAFVMVGEAPSSTAFHGSYERVLAGAAGDVANTASTDPSGSASFFDAGNALAGALTVTAGAPGRGYASVVGVGASDVVLALPRLSSPPPVRLSGNATGTDYPNDDDGYLDLALVAPTLDLDFLASFDIERMFDDVKYVSANGFLCGNSSYAVAGNIHVPLQTEVSCDVSGGESWGFNHPSGAPADVIGLEVRTQVTNLLSGGTINQLLTTMEPRRVGLLPQVSTASSQWGLTVALTHEVTETMPVTIAGAPQGTLVALSIGDLTGGNGGAGRLYLQAFRSVEASTGYAATLGTHAADAPFAAKTNLAAAVSRSSDLSSTSMVIDRTLRDRATARTLAGFYPFPQGSVSGRAFRWQPLASGSVPAPHLARSVLRRVTKTGAWTEEREPFWIVWSPAAIEAGAGERGFTLPTLPPSAPRGSEGGFLTTTSPWLEQRNEWELTLTHLGLHPAAATTGPDFARYRLGAEAEWLTKAASVKVELP